MHKLKFLIAFAIFSFLSPNAAFARDKKYTMDELLAAHLQSIGSPEALKQIHSRVFSGSASVRFIQGATGAWDDGQFSFGSELYRIGIMMKFGALEGRPAEGVSKPDFAPWRGARQIAGGERSEPPELDNGEKSPGSGRGETILSFALQGSLLFASISGGRKKRSPLRNCKWPGNNAGGLRTPYFDYSFLL